MKPFPFGVLWSKSIAGVLVAGVGSVCNKSSEGKKNDGQHNTWIENEIKIRHRRDRIIQS